MYIEHIMSLAAFFPGTRIRCGGYEGVVDEREGRMYIVGSVGTFETLEAFFAATGVKGDCWNACEFWKSWSWWKCKEMLPPYP